MFELKARLRALLDRVGPENIWRPIVDVDGTLLAEGHEDMRDGSPEDLAKVDFVGKTVLDLGCNFGYYSFLVKRLGAESVLGVDVDEEAVSGCRLLSRIYGFEGMEFLSCDFIALSLKRKFDCTLLINFIGKRSLVKSVVPVLETVSAHSRNVIILSARPVYTISRSLQVPPEHLVDLYGEKYVRQDYFFLSEFLQDFFCEHWQMSLLSPDYADQTLKRTFLFTPVISSPL